MLLELSYFPQVAEDYLALPDTLKSVALDYINRLKKEPYLGRPLHYQPSVGNLSDSRKVYFSESPDESPTHRIVYRLLPDEGRPKTVEIIAIGERSQLSVYLEAARRLER